MASLIELSETMCFLFCRNVIARSYISHYQKRIPTAVVGESDYITDDRAYQIWFESVYQVFNYKQFVGDVRQYHHEKENLGEIRSSLMAFYKGIDLFMSDDGEAKRYITNKLSSSRHKIDVYNVYDTLERIGKMEGRNIKWRDVKGMAKRVLDEQRYEELNKIWHMSDQTGLTT